MKKLLPLVVMMFLAIWAFPIIPVSAIEDPIGVNSSLFHVDTEQGGELVVNIAIENKLGSQIEVTVSSWYNYTYPDEGESWIEPSWVTNIIPSTQILPIGGQMITNVQFTIPADANETQYKTWIKIAVGGWEKPITVVIRKGRAIQVIDFSVSPSYYRMSVVGFPAHIDVVDASDNQSPPIGVKSKCGMMIGAYATAESPDKSIEITESSSIKHTPEEVGIIFNPVPTEDAQQWFSTPYNQNSPLSIKGYSTGYITWSLSVPDNVSDGYYAIAVRVQPTQSSGSIVKNYVIWMLLDVDRTDASNSRPYWLIPVVVLSCLVIFIITKRWWLKHIKRAT